MHKNFTQIVVIFNRIQYYSRIMNKYNLLFEHNYQCAMALMKTLTKQRAFYFYLEFVTMEEYL